MKAIRQYEFGPADNLRFEEVPDPVPGEGHVLVRVAAAGVHLLDTFIRAGMTGGPFPPPQLPMTPGREVSGVVTDVGPGVEPSWVGRQVVAHLGMASGGYAELALAPAAALHPLPENLTPEAAVAMIGTGRTALGILDAAEIVAEDVVLVPAAAGGLGTLFVQAARSAGATVAGLAGGPDKVARVRALGADVAVDYRAAGWRDELLAALGERKPTLLLDGVGGEVGRAGLEMLDVGGRIVMFGWSAGEPTQFTTADVVAGSLSIVWVTGPRMLRRSGGLRRLETRALAEAATGRLVPVVNPPFPLADAAQAHTALEERATTGKVVLTP
ncbi:zinc-binding dehydrogenase [Pseudonocardia alaniniphila]|uniref:Zinc-binding dehydrogenase n=1 Tax=Pseudonocardia alaniniphila TaxID=75291 RepID=A0ABS9TGU2_9PSEU|nr:zinc-binding dehydrogenase [Pseudonocardia alaniniphila]MCH6167603.1 zinc-binding dehydrogenase [Pseudonocardia alaniniphila]